MENTIIQTQNEQIVATEGPKPCSRCKSQVSDNSIHAIRPYCRTCWDEMNKKKSETMLNANIKRSKETRASMSASKRANKKTEPERWKLFYNFYFTELMKYEELQRKLKTA